MTGKQRVLGALEGRPVDKTPVTAAYNQLYHEDHFAEITGRPWWELYTWRHMPVDEHLKVYRQLIDAAPFDILQPQIYTSREDRENMEFGLKDGKPVVIDRRTGKTRELKWSAGHPKEDTPHETRKVWTSKDAAEKIQPGNGDRWFESGALDYAAEIARQMGSEHFVMAGGVIGTLYSCSWYVGLTNLYAMLAEEPDLIEEIERRILEKNIESIRGLARCKGDAIYIDDATATNDMISPAMYERFSLPYMTEMVKEIHRLGHKAILIYFGGVADRLEQIASTGADGLIMETTMKGFVNDIDDAVSRVGNRITMFGNLDPFLLEKASDDDLMMEIRRQTEAGRKGRGFVMSTGSPITPDTSLSRVQEYIRLSKRA